MKKIVKIFINLYLLKFVTAIDLSTCNNRWGHEIHLSLVEKKDLKFKTIF